MPTSGLSLVGFLRDEDKALYHLLNICLPREPDAASLLKTWRDAARRLGPPDKNAGLPDIQPIPARQAAHADAVLGQPIFANAWAGAKIVLIEIDPILTYHIAIDLERSEYHAKKFSRVPTLDELMAICLPTDRPSEQFSVIRGTNSLVLKTKSLSVHPTEGFWDPNRMGIGFGVSMPWVHVVRHGGRCFLYNGYHRARSIRAAGVTHMPCILRDVVGHNAVGMLAAASFDSEILDGPNPPTLAHFNNGRALAVSLRGLSKIIHLSWAEHVLPDE